MTPSDSHTHRPSLQKYCHKCHSSWLHAPRRARLSDLYREGTRTGLLCILDPLHWRGRNPLHSHTPHPSCQNHCHKCHSSWLHAHRTARPSDLCREGTRTGLLCTYCHHQQGRNPLHRHTPHPSFQTHCHKCHISWTHARRRDCPLHLCHEGTHTDLLCM